MSAYVRTAHVFEEKDRSEDVTSSHGVYFNNLHLSKAVLDGLTKAGYLKPSPIQLEAIPVAKCGKDVVLQSKSGTGKTLVFAVVALESLDPAVSTVQALILAPTREIAFQNAHVIHTIGSEFPSLGVQVFIGGLPLETDKAKCKICRVAVGTPGRVRQLMECRSLRTETLRLFVLDESDKLMEESFIEDVTWIFSQLPLSKQVVAASATYPEALASLVSRYMSSPQLIRLSREQPSLVAVKQFVCRVGHHPLAQRQMKNKMDVLLSLLDKIAFAQCIIFTNLQTRAESVCAQLTSRGHGALSICASQTQTKRLQTLLKLRQFECRILVATDLAARGIDAENMDLVVHLDPARDAATFVHRTGRAGRFGGGAAAVCIVCEGAEVTELRSMATGTGSSVRILEPVHYQQALTVDELQLMWPQLVELEPLASAPAMGAEGADVGGDSAALRRLLHTGPGASKARPKKKPAPPSIKRSTDAPATQNSGLEEKFADLNVSPVIQEVTGGEPTPAAAASDDDSGAAWSAWIGAWRSHLAIQKELVRQQNYLHLMTGAN